MQAPKVHRRKDRPAAPPKRAALAGAGTPMPVIELQGSALIVSFVNAAFCGLLKKTKRDLIGKPLSDLVPAGREGLSILAAMGRARETLDQARNDPESEPALWQCLLWPAPDPGEPPAGVIVQVTGSPDFRLNAAAINEALLISGLRQHELTEIAERLIEQLEKEVAFRKTAEASLREARDRLADRAGELERLVSERTEKLRETIGELEAFSYSVAHDLRAPLRAVQGFSAALLEGYASRLDETACGYLRRMERAAIRMDKLIQDVLSYAQILAEAPLEPIDLDTLLRDIVGASEDWQPSKAEIHIDGVLPKVLGNEALLGQCLSNLVGNAVKFVPTGSKPRVRIWAESLPEQVRLWIEDNGIGIAPENHARVFRMFERIHAPSQYSGTGIGLAIVRKAVARMRGQAGVESESGTGSRFWIELRKVPNL